VELGSDAPIGPSRMHAPVAPFPARRIARTGLAAATVASLDFLYVFVLWVLIRQRTTTQRLLQSIASGLLGREAYDGGATTAVLGGVLHALIALIWVVTFVLLLRALTPLQRLVGSPRGRVFLGLGYGVFVWWWMDLVVLPLSHARPTPFLSWVFVINTIQHALMVGLPIALIVGPEESEALRPPAR
jgi:hypothetical protein